MRDRWRTLLEHAVGQGIWSAVSGPQGNYVLSLEIGEKRRRATRLGNPKLSFVKRTFEGSHSLLVECPWRIDGRGGVLRSSFEAFERDANPVAEIGELIDHTVEGVELILPGGDLILSLSEGTILRCFALEVRRRPLRRNWTYWCPEGSLSAGPAGRLMEGGAADPRPPAPLEEADGDPPVVVDEDPADDPSS
jgi:hypothetical protein